MIGHDIYMPNDMILTQKSTVGSGEFEFGEQFRSSRIDYANVIGSLATHMGSTTAGSQFNHDWFKKPEDVVTYIDALLPDELQYDQHNRAELTLRPIRQSGRPVGIDGVQSLDGVIRRWGIPVGRRMCYQHAAGQSDEVDGRRGEWSDIIRGGQKLAERFIPESWVGVLPAGEGWKCNTRRLSMIIVRAETGVPTVLAIHPGDITPRSPILIRPVDANLPVINTLKNSSEAEFWDRHAFIEVI